MPNTAEQAIYDRLASAPSFHPANAELLLNDWTLEPGDVVTVKSGEQNYSLPIYSLNLNWTGSNLSGAGNSNTTRIAIESTGHKEREPLPELRRKQFEQGRYAYTGFKSQQQEIDEHYQHVVNVTDKGMSDAFGIIGVSIGADGYPVKDGSGNYVWDDSGTGGEIWGHLNRNAWATQILNHIKDADGNVLSLAEVYTDAYGQAIINAINDQRTGTATINANRIKLNATDTITLDALLGVDVNGDLEVLGNLTVDDDINVTGIYATGTIEGTTIRWNSGHGTLTMEDMYDDYSTCIDSIGPATSSGGQITIPWTKFGGGSGSVNFNIADTQFYIDTVSAFRTAIGDAGWSGNHATLIGATLDTSNKRLNVNSAYVDVMLPGTNSTTRYSMGLGNLDLTTPLTNYYNAAEQAGYNRAANQRTTLTATSNGTYTPSFGYSSVTVNVPSSSIAVNDIQLYASGYQQGTQSKTGVTTSLGYNSDGSNPVQIFSNTVFQLDHWYCFKINVNGVSKGYYFKVSS